MAKLKFPKILPRSKRGQAQIPDQTKEDNDLWSSAVDLRDQGLEAQTAFQRQWIINLAFLAGKQYSFFNATVHRLQELKRARGRSRSVDNQLIWRWRRQVSDFVKNDPTMSVVPSTNDDDDIKAAKLGDKVLRAWWMNDRMRDKVRLLAGWIFSTGNAFLDDRWDPKRGPDQIDPKTGEAIYAGDATCGVWSPFEVLVPAAPSGGCVYIDEFPWLMTYKFRQLEEIHSMPGGERVVAEDFHQPYSNIGSLMGIGGGLAQQEVEGAFLINLKVKPCKKYPKGLFVACANGVILDKQPWPVNHFHMEHFKDIDVPGLFYGKATLEDAIGLQRTWNDNTNSVEEFNKFLAKGKWLIPRGAQLEAMPDENNTQIIQYTPVLGHKPDIMVPKSTPASFDSEQSRIQFSLENLFSQHEVTRGTNKSDIRSEDMLSFLREMDRQGSIPTHTIYEDRIGRTAARVLRRIKDGYTTERMLQIRGEEGEFEVFAFKGADLRTNSDVMVKPESTIPDSRAARERQVLERYQAGYYGDSADPRTQRRVQRLLDDAVHKDIHSELYLDEGYANWENEILANPEITNVVVNPYDNDGVHIEEHQKYMKSLRFQRLKVENPQAFEMINNKFLIHLMTHQKRLAEQQQNQMQQQAQFEVMKEKIKGGEKASGNNKKGA